MQKKWYPLLTQELETHTLDIEQQEEARINSKVECHRYMERAGMKREKGHSVDKNKLPEADSLSAGFELVNASI